MTVSKSQQKAVHKYVKANYDRMELTVPKGQKDTIKTHASTRGESVNGFIGRAILEAMARDSGGTPSETAGKPAETAEGGGGIPVSPDTLEAAQRAAEAARETLPEFIARAVETQVQRDQASLRLGINPTMENKLEENQD